MPRPRSLALLYGVAALVFVVDRLTKLWAERSLAGRDPIEIIPGVLRFAHTRNTGGAFSLGTEAPVFFALATIVISMLIVVVSLRPHPASVAAGLGAVLGGALGNLTDRIVHGPGLTGSVTDFIDIHVLPVFNVADCGIVLGAISLALLSARRDAAGAA